MSAAIRCPACEKRFKVTPQQIGKTGACPGCGKSITIGPQGVVLADPKPTKPAAKPQASKRAPAPKLTETKLREAVTGSIRPVRATLVYRLSLLVATFVILLTPIVYLALIAATGYGVYYHAINHTGILTAVRGRAVIFAFLAYAAPIVAGATMVLFMLKPFFSRPRYDSRRRSLVRENEPLLFAFVDLICESVRAPRPKRIDIDCQMNASASFRKGMLSMLGNDLVLTIGAPMVAGLSIRQFGGVLAHEFGHFSQGAGMRLTYVLRSVTAWLQRSVYQRDGMDESLQNAAAEADIRFGWILWLAILMVWLARRVLWLLMMLSMAVVGFVLRQMEYDADRYEARFAGSDEFEKTTTKMARLSVAMQKAFAQLGVSHRDGKLVDDLPKLVQINETKLEKKLASAIADSLREGQTGWFDSHPNDRDRIASARREEAEGVFRLDGPAGALFQDFDAQCRATTWEYYRQVLGNTVRPEQLKPVDAIGAEHANQGANFEALWRYTQGAWRASLRTGLTREALTPPESAKELVEAAHRGREAFLATLSDQAARVEKLDKRRDKLAEARAYQELHRAGVRIPKKQIPEGLENREAASAVRKESQRRVNLLSQQIEEANDAFRVRLTVAVQLVCHDAIAKRMPGGVEQRQRVHALVPALLALEGQLSTINSLRENASVLMMLVNAAQSKGATEELIDSVVMLTREVHPQLSQIRDVLMLADYPFEHTDGKASLGARLIPGVPSRDEIGDVLNAADIASDNLVDMHCRILAELCGIAERVEKAIKLPPLPERKPEAEEVTA